MAKDQIFISYFAGDDDDVAFASRLRSRLEGEGFKTFSNLSLKVGDDWEQTLFRELNDSKYIIVLLSPGALTSEKVGNEVRAGLRRESERAAKVIPVLHKPCPPADVEKFVGKKFYAVFTEPGDFESGFKNLLSDLSDGGGRRRPKRTKSGGVSKLMSMDRRTQIILALITAAVGLTTAYWQWVYKPAHDDKPQDPGHFGRVLNAETQRPIKDATVFVESKGVPRTHYSDSNGLFPIDADKSLGAVHVRVDAANCKPFDGNLPLPASGVLDIRLQCSEGKSEPAPPPGHQPVGFTYDHNPTIDEVRSNIQTVRKVSITYSDRRCEQLARKAVVRLNGAQLNGVDAKDILENGARPRTDVQFSVNIRQAGASYEIVCAK